MIGALTGFGGMYVSYGLDIASGPAIVLLQASVFSAALLITSIRKTAMRRLLNVDV
jgi:manganese/iron transport system permease protein/iron/zinc/copper transport system permease protein